MARPQSPPILAQLRSARTIPEQAAALRALKNDVVGHVQKKQQWVALGVLEPIVRTIAPARPHAKLNGKGTHAQFCSRPLSEEDDAKLQALQLLASFAHGGPAFLAPMNAARALPGIMANISPYTNPPQIVVAALRALMEMTDAAALAAPSSPITTESLAEYVFSHQHLDSFQAILSISSAKHLLQSQVTLACGLVYRLCVEEKQQHALTVAGVLDCLATRLASFAVAQRLVIPGAVTEAKDDGLFEAFPEPAPDSAKLEPVLRAIAAILGESKYRAHRLVYSPSILAVFPSIPCEAPGSAQGGSIDIGYHAGDLGLSAMEYLLPVIPIHSSRSTPTSLSSMGTPDRSDSQTSSRNSHTKVFRRSLWDSVPSRHSTTPDTDPEEVESPLIPWLIHLVRSQADDERLMAASVLTCLYKAGLGAQAVREASIGLLVVPILVDMVVKNDKDVSPSQVKGQAMRRTILEQAPLVLARLIIDCEYLQKAAADCQAVKALTRLLRRAYIPLDASRQPAMWSPYPDTDMEVEGTSSVSRLGDRGQDDALAHNIRLRESALKAIGALAAGKEDYRKALVAEDFVPYVVESLSEFPRKPRAPKERSKDKNPNEAAPTTVAPEYGRNPLSVIIAACHVVRVLSRSISVLRTSLVDHGVAIPILDFLKHPDINVQNAASATIANLVVEVSPVRELLTEKGVMTILCEHAHSDNPSLRLNALWALKHFVDAVGPDLKKACLEELGSGWLVQLIRDDTQDAAFFNGRSGKSPGEDMDEDVDLQSPDEKHRWQYVTNGDIRELDASCSTRMRQAEDKLTAIRESELNPARRARNDDLAIQEQGLDFIRNFIGRPGPFLQETPDETTEMIDHLFNELGQGRLFRLLASKLRPKYLHPFSRRAPVAGREARVIHPQAQIIAPVIYILVHMAASDSRHRQLVIAETELLKLLVQHAGKDREVRVALCHLVTNLTVRDEEGEAEACRQRAAELRKLGFQDKLEALKLDDRDLDVRERAKQAVFQMEEASNSSH